MAIVLPPLRPLCQSIDFCVLTPALALCRVGGVLA